MSYRAPIRDLRFALEDIAAIEGLKADGGFPDLNPELIQAVLEAAGQWTSEVLAPLNRPGDQFGTKLENNVVRTAPGFREAYAQFVEGGWQGLPFEAAMGGQDLPKALALAVFETMHSANMSFGLCPMLTLGAIEAIAAHGDDDQKRVYLPKLVTGEWTGSMNLTEPQAGSDVGALTSKAEPVGDGSWRIRGQKIFITYGEHDMADNIVHLVLARTPGAPAGTRGISLFLVPKFIPDAEGKPGKRNDMRCIGIEHKMGIHASPTCTLAFGDGAFADPPGALGWMIGGENRGMAAMFTMMNSARINVGQQGVGIAEASFQKALSYVQDRKQGKAEGAGARSSFLYEHADIRRMLMTMKVRIAAARALCFVTAVAGDAALRLADEEDRRQARMREEFLTPIAKAWSTDMANEVTSIGIQIHGGMGFVEEGGAAQFYRDARIATIYEGTNGIQAIDLVGRKMPMDNGAPFQRLLADMQGTCEDCQASSNEAVINVGEWLQEGIGVMREAGEFILDCLREARADALAGATPFLKLCGDVVGGWLLAKGALAATRHLKADALDNAYWNSRIALADFYAENILAGAAGQLPAIMAGAELLFEADLESLAG